MSGHRELAEFIAGVERLRDMNTRVAKEAAPKVEKIVRQTANSGTTPTGEEWPELKKGGRALEDAENAVSSTTKGPQIVIKIRNPYGFHQRGDGVPKRQIVPASGEPIPKAMNEAIADTAKGIFEKAVG